MALVYHTLTIASKLLAQLLSLVILLISENILTETLLLSNLTKPVLCNIGNLWDIDESPKVIGTSIEGRITFNYSVVNEK